MKDTLEELRGSMGGILGSFVIGGQGGVDAEDVPEIMGGALPRVSKTIYHVLEAIGATKKLEKMTVDSENGKLIVIPAGERILVVIAEKSINVPLLRLMSNMAVSKIKAAPAVEAPKAAEEKKEEAPPAESAEAERILDVYGRMYEVTAKKITFILGPGAAKLFEERIEGVRGKHPALLKGVSVGGDGRPDMARLKENAKGLSRDELVAGLEDVLAAMVDAVGSTAGGKVAEKTLTEIAKIKEENKI
ncbi:MAG: hypothetical protein D6733_01515 [Methanobacteriota archaeon]|nr:MAG: hypothetical protein D6733_01515 [Euryarchaeota archaeon]